MNEHLFMCFFPDHYPAEYDDSEYDDYLEVYNDKYRPKYPQSSSAIPIFRSSDNDDYEYEPHFREQEQDVEDNALYRLSSYNSGIGPPHHETYRPRSPPSSQRNEPTHWLADQKSRHAMKGDSENSGGFERHSKRDRGDPRMKVGARRRENGDPTLRELDIDILGFGSLETKAKKKEVARGKEELQINEEGARRKEQETKQKEREVRKREEETEEKEEGLRKKDEVKKLETEVRKHGEEIRRHEELKKREVRKCEEEVRKREEEVGKREEEVRKREEVVGKREEEVRKREEEVKKCEEEVRKCTEEAQQKAELEARQKNDSLDVCARLFILLQTPESFKKLASLQEHQAQEMMDLLQNVRLAPYLFTRRTYMIICASY